MVAAKRSGKRDQPWIVGQIYGKAKEATTHQGRVRRIAKPCKAPT
jgi:hypothetical protein